MKVGPSRRRRISSWARRSMQLLPDAGVVFLILTPGREVVPSLCCAGGLEVLASATVADRASESAARPGVMLSAYSRSAEVGKADGPPTPTSSHRRRHAVPEAIVADSGYLTWSTS